MWLRERQIVTGDGQEDAEIDARSDAGGTNCKGQMGELWQARGTGVSRLAGILAIRTYKKGIIF